METYSEQRYKKVVKSNDLIQQGRFNVTLQQYRAILYIISKINTWDDTFKEYTFSFTEFFRVFCIDENGGKAYIELKSQLKAISDKSIWAPDENGKLQIVRLMDTVKIDPTSRQVTISIHRAMKPYLLQLKANFTQYELINVVYMHSKYAIRLYELVKSIHYNELQPYTRTFTVDDLKYCLLDVDDETATIVATAYNNFSNFRNRVLNPAVEEINQLTDKHVEYATTAKGRKVTHVTFTVAQRDIVDILRTRVQTEGTEGDNAIYVDILRLMGGTP